MGTIMAPDQADDNPEFGSRVALSGSKCVISDWKQAHYFVYSSVSKVWSWQSSIEYREDLFALSEDTLLAITDWDTVELFNMSVSA